MKHIHTWHLFMETVSGEVVALCNDRDCPAVLTQAEIIERLNSINTPALDVGKRIRLLRRIETLAWTIIDSAGKGYISSNDIDLANDCLDKAMAELQPAATQER